MAILGIDEVGRGPWAGPLVIGAVILPTEKPTWIDELNDSKKLSVKKREELNEIILKEAPATGLGWVPSRELDEVGLSNALRLAARRAVEAVQKCQVPFSEIIIDGTQNFLIDTALEKYVTVLKKADFLIKEVSAASIIAKVARDHYMYGLAAKYPDYGFEKHVGYGTAFHQKALKDFGPCPEHRMSFGPLKSLGRTSLDETSGAKAESKVADFLISNGHQIVARNYKTKYYEIDIISTKDQTIYFTEVKYRESSYRGTPLEAITKEKQKQMFFAAESFLATHLDLKKFNPILAAAAVSGLNFQIDDWFIIS